MNRTLIALSLALAATICWIAVSAGLLPGQIGWFAATVLSMLSGLAWWAPFTRRSRDRDRE